MFYFWTSILSMAILLASQAALAQFQAGSSYRLISSCGAGNAVVSVGAFPSIAIATKSTSSSQIFEVVASRSGFYLKSKSSGEVLGTAADGYYKGAYIQQRTASGHPTQTFTAQSLGGDLFAIKNSGSGYYLTVIADRTSDGTGLIQSTYFGVCGKKFRLEKVEAATVAPRSAYSTLQAEGYNSQSGSRTTNGIVGYLDAGDFLHYKAIDFEDGANSVSLSLAVPEDKAGKKIEVRLGSTTGPLAGELTVQSTGSWSTFKPQAINLTTAITGVHDLYLIMAGGTDVANIDSLIFSKQVLASREPSSTPSPELVAARNAFSTIQAETYDSQSGSRTTNGIVGYLDAGDYLLFKAVGFEDGARSVSFSLAVPADKAGKKIEVHLDSQTGPLVGALTVQSTGGWSTFESQAIDLNSTVSGAHDLYLVMSGGADVANIDSLVFSKQSTATAPISSPTPQPTSSTTPNSVQTIIDDMGLASTYPIAVMKNGVIVEATGGYPNKYASVVMGNFPHGQASPTWWSPSPGYESLRNIAWSETVPWIVVLTGIGNSATSTRIEFRNLKSYYKIKSTGKWVLITEGSISGYNCSPGQWDNCSDPTDIVTTANGTRSLRPSGTGSNFHGWSGRARIPNVYDVEIVYNTIQARIVGPDASKAQYMIHVGNDFYPPGTTVNQMSGYNPGSGASRSKGLTTSWQSFNYATLNNAPNIVNSRYTVSPGVLSVSPPPLQ